jgi:hypothetical protein
MQYSEIWRSSLKSLPPMYLWPPLLKRLILTLALLICGLAYLILTMTGVGLLLALLTLE